MTRHAGLRPWILQRISAVYLAFYSVFLLLHFALQTPVNYAVWKHWVTAPAISIGTALFFLTLLLHVWVGLRDIMMDYVPTSALRLALSAGLALGLCACGLWTLRILWVTGNA